MDICEDLQLVGLKQVDDPIALDDQFAHIVAVVGIALTTMTPLFFSSSFMVALECRWVEVLFDKK